MRCCPQQLSLRLRPMSGLMDFRWWLTLSAALGASACTSEGTSLDDGLCPLEASPETALTEVRAGVWRRDLPVFRDGCARYGASVTFDLTATSPEDWRYVFDAKMCNACDEPRYVHWVTPDESSEVTEFEEAVLRADSTMFGLADSVGRGYLPYCWLGCERVAWLPYVVNTFALERGKTIAFELETPAKALHYDGFQTHGNWSEWDAIDYQDSISGFVYWPILRSNSQVSGVGDAAHIASVCDSLDLRHFYSDHGLTDRADVEDVFRKQVLDGPILPPALHAYLESVTPRECPF